VLSISQLDETLRELRELTRLLEPIMLTGERPSETLRRLISDAERPRPPLVSPEAKGWNAATLPHSPLPQRLNLAQLVAATPWLTMGTLRRFLLHRHTNGLARCVTELDGLLLIDPQAFNRWIDERPARKPRKFGANPGERDGASLRKFDHR
jgi:hypothetical protein